MFREYQRLGEILVKKGLLNEDKLQQALRSQAYNNSRLGEILAAMGWLSEEDLARALAEQYSYTYIDADEIQPNQEALKVVPGRWALSKLILPVAFYDNQLEVAVADPIDIESTDEIRMRAGCPIDFVIAKPSTLRSAIIRCYTLDLETAPIKKASKHKTKIDHQVDKAALLNALDRFIRGAA